MCFINIDNLIYIKIASRVLNIPSSKIFISETNTNVVPNASGTNGSMSSDLNGMAVYVSTDITIEKVVLVKKQ